ncbi:MalY/PatB family protein [Alkalihalobacterium elongatum]|uniref:MalY/PatB family protein n=1 Tax=Alkalihalobacterium elongatum TaxID=2675466 RepID=UPI001C1F51C3|nr:MalY/PatB family protein [Alkalihalobacterium elongatum]
MTSRFDHVENRKGTNSMKWDGVDKLYGGNDLWPMWVADMDFKAPSEVITAVQKEVNRGIFGYPIRSASVDSAVQSWLKRRFSWEIDTEHLVYTSGVVPAIAQLIKRFTEPGDKVIIQPPVYYPFFKVVTNQERQLIENPLVYDGIHYRMDFDHLKSVIDEKTKILLLCSPHNPVGRVWTISELEQLAEICIEHDLLVISDEIHSDMVFKGHRHVPTASLSDEMKQRTITCMAPSKTFNLAGLQTSYTIISNPTLRRQFKNYLSGEFLNMFHSIGAVAMEAAYNEGEEWLEEFLHYLHENVRYVTSYVREHMPKIKVIQPEGTYLLWMDCTELGMTAQERKDWLTNQAKVALSNGIVFGKEGEPFERMNLACSRESVIEGLTRLKKAYDELS